MLICGRQKKAGDNKNKDAASPTVSTESVFMQVVVDAHKGWDVATFDILRAYLHT